MTLKKKENLECNKLLNLLQKHSSQLFSQILHLHSHSTHDELSRKLRHNPQTLIIHIENFEGRLSFELDTVNPQWLLQAYASNCFDFSLSSTFFRPSFLSWCGRSILVLRLPDIENIAWNGANSRFIFCLSALTFVVFATRLILGTGLTCANVSTILDGSRHSVMAPDLSSWLVEAQVGSRWSEIIPLRYLQ